MKLGFNLCDSALICAFQDIWGINVNLTSSSTYFPWNIFEGVLLLLALKGNQGDEHMFEWCIAL